MPDTPGLERIKFSSTSNYTVIQELGRGGMGIVYLAEKNCEGVIDYVVLKTIRVINTHYLNLLKHEANIATILRHENIVKTYGLEAIPIALLPEAFQEQLLSLDAPAAAKYQQLRTKQYERPNLAPAGVGGSPVPVPGLAETPGTADRPATTRQVMPRLGELRDDEKLFCMAMDYVEGTDLGRLHRHHLRAGLLIPVELGAFVISRICRALAYAHRHIIHRDISPENILVNTHGVAKLTDFGIAVAAGDTQTFAGKVLYMAPEQIWEQEIDARADIYALGIVAYQIATGISLFAPQPGMDFDAAITYVKNRMQQPLISPEQVRADIPDVLGAIIARMLAPDPAERYQSMEEAGNALEQDFLYAKGFGPTNNSLAAYIELFSRDFADPEQRLLKQLSFLRVEGTDRLLLRRPFTWNQYTTEGRQLIESTQHGQLMHKILQRGPQPKTQG